MMATHWYPRAAAAVGGKQSLDHYHEALLAHGVSGYGRDRLRRRLSAVDVAADLHAGLAKRVRHPRLGLVGASPSGPCSRRRSGFARPAVSGGRPASCPERRARQGLALQPLQKRAARRGHVGQFFQYAGLAHAEAVSPPPAMLRSASAGRLGHRFSQGHCRHIERRCFEGAEGTVPNQGFQRRQARNQRGDRGWADVEHHAVGRNGVDADGLGRWVGPELGRHHGVHRQHDLASGGRGPAKDVERAISCISASCNDLPTALPCAARNVFAMAPPMIRTFTLVTRLPSSFSLVDTFAPPTIAATGRWGLPRAASNASSSACIRRPA